MTAHNAEIAALTDDQLEAAGFAKRYRLCGHPAYPDPLNIWPPTEENAARIHALYVLSFDDFVERLGRVPRQFSGSLHTAETWNPRILITWEYVAEKQVFRPGTGGSS